MSTRPRTPAPGTPRPGKLPITELALMKERHQPIVMVTAYDAPSGRLADAAGVDLILVGDSAAMTVLGHDSTVPASMDEMIVLTRAVTRGARRPLVIADMPFGSFQVSDAEAISNAIRFVKEAGADAVKLEGAGPSLSRAQAIVGAGVPVMGHVGLTPQSATALGGFRAQGRTADQARRLVDDARALEAAGCFAIVLEAVPAPVAAEITERLTVPTIGIGAGAETDGQCSSRTTCWASTTALAALREAVRRPRALDRRRGAAYADDVRERPLSGSGAHVRDVRRGARGVPRRGAGPAPVERARQHRERGDHHAREGQRADDAAPREAEGRPERERRPGRATRRRTRARLRSPRPGPCRCRRPSSGTSPTRSGRRSSARSRPRTARRDRGEGDDLARDPEGRLDPDALRPQPQREAEKEVAAAP